jgi:hypothetical protein
MLLYFVSVASRVALLIPIRIFTVFPNLILRINSYVVLVELEETCMINFEI